MKIVVTAAMMMTVAKVIAMLMKTKKAKMKVMTVNMTEMLPPNTRRLHGCISTGLTRSVHLQWIETRLVTRLTKT